MREIQVDVAVIGACTAGLSAYRAAKTHTDNTIMIENGPYGTTCARVGCMPSKLLIAAANRAHAFRQAAPFGIEASTPVIDGAAVMQRVRDERDRFAGFVVETVEELPAADKLRGTARFLDNNRLEVDDHTLVHADKVVIASGPVPQMLDMPIYHPVVEEGLRTALRNLNANLRFGPDIVEHCIECGPGA